jgi:glucose 1-dehydrogenase
LVTGSNSGIGAAWRRVIEVNLTGQFLSARKAVRRFLHQGIGPAVSCAAGKIIGNSKGVAS